MDVATVGMGITALGLGFVLVRLFLTATPGRIPQKEWDRLRNKVDRIVAEMDSSDSPKPTGQMCRLLVVGEDHRFPYHPGVDPIALCRAIWKTVFCDRRQGGSTIAMQLLRSVTGRYEWTCKRKLLEIFLAIRLTHHIGRERLPALYLWVAYYGWRMNNFDQACSRVHIEPLSASEFEAAMLVARIKYPEPRDLHREQLRKIRCRAAHLISLRNSSEKNRLWNHLAFRTR